ncbi:MAG: ArsA-related P-loop ATPase [Myxococcota bacterium]
MARKNIGEMLKGRSIVVCVGSGGVGKTTTSAVLALHAAIEGRRVLVLTIDPARRLANSLGVSELDNDERQIPLEQFAQIGVEPRGELWAMMLDMKRSFDRIVERNVKDPRAIERILNNKLYNYFSTSLAGTQEYSAMERLYELHKAGTYDLIVLDTPPTIHALDFLDAPNRMAEAVESSALQWLYKPSVAAGKFGFGLFNIGTSYVLKTLSRFTGSEMLDELRTFLQSLSPLFDGFGDRARRIRDVLGSDDALFFVITSPDPITVDEARYFQNRLNEEAIPFGGFIVNRVHAPYLPDDGLDSATSTQLAEAMSQLNLKGLDDNPTQEELAALGEQMIENAAEFQVLADLDAQTLRALRERTGPRTSISTVPFFSRDIHSFEGLNRVRQQLFGLDAS